MDPRAVHLTGPALPWLLLAAAALALGLPCLACVVALMGASP